MTKELRPSISIDYRSKTIILNESGWNIKFMMEEKEEENGKMDLGVLREKPNSELSKLKLFMEVFASLAMNEGDVPFAKLCTALLDTERFRDADHVKDYLNKALQNGLIYERRKGWYAKA